MSHRIRRILSAAIVVAAASVTTACVIPLPTQPQQTTPQTQPADPVETTQPATDPTETTEPVASGPTAADEAALAAYVEGERSVTQDVLDQTPGFYEEVTIDGVFETIAGDPTRPDGTYAVVTFSYVYAEPADWAAATEHLEGERTTIDDMCESTLFPALRARGLTTPISITYAYGDVTSGGPMWSHTCWTT